MRWFVSIGAALIASVMAGDVPSLAAPGPQSEQRVTEKDGAAPVDVELILAVDVSYSMDMDELAIQREGYAQAIVSKEFLQALKTGPNGKVAITYFEWAASSDQKIIIPWRLIDGPETADAVAAEIMKTPIRRASRTSISGAITFAMPLFASMKSSIAGPVRTNVSTNSSSIEPSDWARRYSNASATVNSPSGERLWAGIHTMPPETAVVPPTVEAFS